MLLKLNISTLKLFLSSNRGVRATERFHLYGKQNWVLVEELTALQNIQVSFAYVKYVIFANVIFIIFILSKLH